MPLSIGEVVHERRSSCFVEESSKRSGYETFEEEISQVSGPEIKEAYQCFSGTDLSQSPF